MSDILDRIDPDNSIRWALQNVASGNGSRYTGALDALRYLAERGDVRLPGEPTLAELRAKVEALPTWCRGVSWETALIDHVQRKDVLALFDPKRADPGFRFGDFVTNAATGGTALYLRGNGADGICVSTNGFYDVWKTADVRAATADEIATARG
ncbi:MAG: hypothetical protein JWO85_2567 [Candidatus Eremiobacteraeota bacterium]|nr:hypothetical protein [Candidatus Eremiobacteraeota bacterium]